MRVVGGLSGVIGLGAAALVVVLTAAGATTPAGPGEVAVPDQLASYSHVTGSVSASAPGRATALFQHGFGVELLDLPQAVVLGADGDSYRRVDAAEDRAGAETQGDPAPMLLSPDGTKVAVGDHDTGNPDVVVVDLLTGTTTTHPLPTGRSVIPVAWSRDGRTLAHLLSPAPTDPYSGGRITGQVGLLDLTDDTALVLPEDEATAAAFSPDGSELAVEQADMIRGKRLRPLATVSDKPLELEGYGTIPPLSQTLPGFTAPANYFGIFIPKGVPDEVVKTVERIWAENIAKSEAIKKYANSRGALFAPSAGEAAQKAVFPAIQANAWLLFNGGKAKVSPDTVGIPKP